MGRLRTKRKGVGARAGGGVAAVRDYFGTFQYVDLEDRTIHTNTVEGAFSIFKRGMRGVYQHCAEHHLHRYLAEFEFRYNNRVANGVNDRTRAVRAMEGIIGKRITYHQPDARA